MKSLIFVFMLSASSLAHSAIISAIRFTADVVSFDKQSVQVKANGKKFRVDRKIWEFANGPVKTGNQQVALKAGDFATMKAQEQ